MLLLLLAATGRWTVHPDRHAPLAGTPPADLPVWSVEPEIPAGPVEALWQRDHEALEVSLLSRIAQWMEAARDDDSEARCTRHWTTAAALANRYPTLLAPWRLIWDCTPSEAPRREALRQWLVTLLDHAERHLERAAWPELGLEVHSLIDALSLVELRGDGVLDAWYLPLADGQVLRLAVHLWRSDEGREGTLYFIPLSEIEAGRRLLTDPVCRVRQAECIVENIPTTGYIATRLIAAALLKRQRGENLEALKKIAELRESSFFAAETTAEWMLADYHWPDIAETMPDILSTALEHDSAAAKAMKAMLIEEGYLAAESDDELATLQSAAAEELGAGVALELKARFLDNLNPAAASIARRYRRAAGAGDAAAKRWLAEREGEAPSAVAWWVQAAHSGDREAMFELGRRFHLGRGMERDEHKALYWWRRAAELGHPGALFEIAELGFAGGLPAALDAAQAAESLRRSAELGHAAAQRRLAELGATNSLPLSTAEQYHWLRRAADQKDALAQRRLAEWLWHGRATAPDPEAARALLEQAWELGDPEAAARLGDWYLDQTRPRTDPAKAIGYLQAAAQAFEHGQGIEADWARAVQLYSRAGEAGSGADYLQAIRLLVTGGPGLAADPERAKELIGKILTLHKAGGLPDLQVEWRAAPEKPEH